MRRLASLRTTINAAAQAESLSTLSAAQDAAMVSYQVPEPQTPALTLAPTLAPAVAAPWPQPPSPSPQTLAMLSCQVSAPGHHQPGYATSSYHPSSWHTANVPGGAAGGGEAGGPRQADAVAQGIAQGMGSGRGGASWEGDGSAAYGAAVSSAPAMPSAPRRARVSAQRAAHPVRGD